MAISTPFVLRSYFNQSKITTQIFGYAQLAQINHRYMLCNKAN